MKPSPAHLDAGPCSGGSDPASKSHQLFSVVLDTSPQNVRPTRLREGAGAGQPHIQRPASRHGALKALEQLIHVPISHIRKECESEVPLLGHRPTQLRSCLLARLEELGQVLLDRFGQRQRDKHPHGHTSCHIN